MSLHVICEFCNDVQVATGGPCNEACAPHVYVAIAIVAPVSLPCALFPVNFFITSSVHNGTSTVTSPLYAAIVHKARFIGQSKSIKYFKCSNY